MDKIIEYIAVPVIILMLLFIIIMLPTQIIAETNCLEKGYPSASVTYKFDVYCTGVDGVVKSDVIKL